MLDLLIKNARIIDGTGSEGYRGWIGVRMEEIVGLGMGACKPEIELEAQQVIDAKGMILCPGFIDIHSHGDISLISHSFSPEKIWQGVTTQTIGHCGISAAPFSEAWSDFLTHSLLGQMGAGWKGKSFGDYMGFLSQRELGTNVAPLVGYAPIRMAVRGSSPEEPDRKELKMMAELLDEAMRAGSFGFTTGLAYPPQCQATTDELAALCEVVAHHGGIYATHVRDIIYDIISGLKEAIEIGRRSGVRVHIAHLQVRPNPYYNLQDVLSLMEKARQEGIEVTCDHYDYLAGQGPLTPLFPAWALGGGLETIRRRLKNDKDRKRIKQYMREIVEQYFEWSDVILWITEDDTLSGKSIQTLAHIEEKDPRDVVMDVLLKNGLSTGALFFGKTEKDLCSAAAWKHSVAGTDGIFFENQRQNHPRTFGTFPRMIRKYVCEQSVFTLEEAIHRMSGMTAEILGLSDRGVLSKGRRADILIIDPQRIKDTATYEEPFSKAQGIELVVVNGKIVKSGDNDFPIAAGRVLNLNRAES